MFRTTISLLGTPRIEHNGVPVEVDTRKAIALAAYLAVTKQSHTRDALAALLWPEYNQSRARAALRRTGTQNACVRLLFLNWARQDSNL